MKIAQILIVAALSIPKIGFSQKTEVPVAVNNSFTKEFENVTNETVTWISKDDKFVVKFIVEGKKSEITYNSNGLKLESLVEISKERLKHHHYDYVTENYPNGLIFHAYFQNTETAPQRFVLDVLENGKTIRLYFRPDGTFFQEQKL